MNASALRISPARADDPHASTLIGLYLVDLAKRLESFDPSLSTRADPDDMAPPHGVFLLGYEGDTPVACVGLETLAPGIGEIKRMFVIEEARRKGYARKILLAIEEHARSLGHRRVVLDTAGPLEQAAALYGSSGYRQVDPYNDNPYAERWFAKAW